MLVERIRREFSGGGPVAPFVLALVPSPEGDRFAVAIAYPDGRAGIEIQIRSASKQRSVSVAAFEALWPALMTWDPSGQRLAFASGARGGIWSALSPPLNVSTPPSRWLGFDAEGSLWGLSAERLWLLASSGRNSVTVREHSEAVAASCAWPIPARVVAAAGHFHVQYEYDGKPCLITWPLSVSARPRIQMSIDGRSIFVSASRPSTAGRVRLELGCIDVATGHGSRFFEGDCGIGLGQREPVWSPWTHRSVLLAAEFDEHASVFLVEANDGAVLPVSPKGLEVSAIAAAPRSSRVAFTCSPLDGDRPETLLVVSTALAGREWSTTVVREGVNGLPSWDRDGSKLFSVHSTGFPTVDFRVDDETSWSGRPARPPGIGVAAAPCDLELRSERTEPAAVLYVAAPHRHFVDGIQSTFFHHAIVTLLARLADDGIAASCLNPPGSSGWGRGYREPERPWSQMVDAALAARIQELRGEGVERIGVVAGSLGTLPILRLLGTDMVAAALLVSPVFSSRLSVLHEWSHLFDDAMLSTTPEMHARNIRAPLMIVHGLRDEMAETGQTSRFLTHLPNTVRCDYITLPGEGHIFAQPDSWEQMLNSGTDFFRHHLLRSHS